jgi:multidrug resistance efflux pump
VPDLSKRRWWVLLVVMAGGLAGGAHLLSVALRGDVQPAPTTSASGPTVRSVAAIGTVDVESGVCRMYLTVPGAVVSQVLVKRGEGVGAGAVLVKCDDALARKKVDQAKAAVDAAKAALANGRSLPLQHDIKIKQAQNAIQLAASQRDAAKLNLETKQRLLRADTAGGPETVRLAEEELRQAEKQLQIRQQDLDLLKHVDPTAQVRQLEAQVAGAEATLAEARESLRQYVLTAPSDGIVLDIAVRAGDTVGLPSATPAVQFCPAGPRVVKADIEQAFAPLVAVGQRVSIQDDANGPGRWTGRVTWVADWYTNPRPVIVPDPGQFSDVRGMPCTITLDPGQPPLKINQRVIATIDVSTK